MRPRDLTVRCFARKEDGVWVAACIDFSLAAQGSTLDEARHHLHMQIVSYVNEAMSIDREHAEMLLQRHAPLWDVVRFNVLMLMVRIGVAIRRMMTYEEQLPLKVASAC